MAPPKTTGNQDWHAIAHEQVQERLGTGNGGLTEVEAAARLREHGPNRLPERRGTPLVLRFLRHFHNVLIYLLLVAALVTALLGHWIDFSVIVAVVLINATIGFIQEGRAERAMRAVHQMLAGRARVERDGERRERPVEDLVPGDLIHLRAGDRVPADLRLIRARELSIDEASLTGESEPVTKDCAPVAAGTGLADRRCMAYSGTLVRFGKGRGVVVATAGKTELGRINRMLADVKTLTTPLLRELDRFGRWLSVWILGISVFVAAIGWWRGMSLDELFLATVGIAVAAIPEGLPAIMTIALALGVQRMARRRAIIRRLPAVETLGAVSVICSDKTGTLTRGEMVAQRIALAGRDLLASGLGLAPAGAITAMDGRSIGANAAALDELLRAAVLCNDARLIHDGEWKVEGMPTEAALLTMAGKAGVFAEPSLEQYPRLDLLPFASEHKLMASLHRAPEGPHLFIKGAPEALARRCSQQRGLDGPEPYDAVFWDQRAEALAAEGYRVLAIASRDERSRPVDQGLAIPDLDQGLMMLGLVGLLDPPRGEAIEAVRMCRVAGIEVKMITGDHALTARAVAAQLGIHVHAGVLTGAEIEAIADADLPERAAAVDVFARVSPEHKLRLVTALQSTGAVVAMTGDGVNDAPALKRADVGIAMGIKGTEVAKEAAEMVLADDNFASIVDAVEEGRTVYDNLRKSLSFILPTNGGEALVVILAILLGLTMPITPVQILWVNMTTAVTLSLALAFEPMEHGAMRRPPRPVDAPLVSAPMLWQIGFVSALLCTATMGMFFWVEASGASVEMARGVAINTLIAGEVMYLFSLRMIDGSVFSKRGLRATAWVWGASLAVLVMQLLFSYWPRMQGWFGVEGPELQHWLAIAGVSFVLLLLIELQNWLLRRHHRLAS